MKSGGNSFQENIFYKILYIWLGKEMIDMLKIHGWPFSNLNSSIHGIENFDSFGVGCLLLLYFYSLFTVLPLKKYLQRGGAKIRLPTTNDLVRCCICWMLYDLLDLSATQLGLTLLWLKFQLDVIPCIFLSSRVARDRGLSKCLKEEEQNRLITN